MRPTVDTGALRQTRASEHLTRFVFGGALTAAAGLVAHSWGPAIGGLLLAFPAILPASLTLVARHDGRREAAEEARGAVLGAAALGTFAIVASLLALRCGPGVTLAAATVTWLVSAVGLWGVVHGRRSS